MKLNGVSITTITKIAQGGQERHFTRETCIEICEFYLSKQAISTKDIVTKFELSEPTISKIFSGNYIDLSEKLLIRVREKADLARHNAAQKTNVANRKLTLEQAGQALWLCQQSSARQVIADHFGINTGTLSGLVSRRNYKKAVPVECWKLYEKLNIRERIKEDREKATRIGKLKWLTKRTNKIKAVADYFGVPQSSVTNIKGAEKYGFKYVEAYPEIPCENVLLEITSGNQPES